MFIYRYGIAFKLSFFLSLSPLSLQVANVSVFVTRSVAMKTEVAVEVVPTATEGGEGDPGGTEVVVVEVVGPPHGQMETKAT